MRTSSRDIEEASSSRDIEEASGEKRIPVAQTRECTYAFEKQQTRDSKVPFFHVPAQIRDSVLQGTHNLDKSGYHVNNFLISPLKHILW